MLELLNSRRLAALFALLAFMPWGTPALAQDPDLLSVGLGMFNAIERQQDTAEGRIEYQFGRKAFGSDTFFKGLGPMVGLMANAEGGVFGYGAGYLDLRFGKHVVVWPTAGAGGYREGNSTKLGGVFQFHFALTVAYRFDNDHRLGLTFAHISNAGLHDANPGNNSLLFTYSYSIGEPF